MGTKDSELVARRLARQAQAGSTPNHYRLRSNGEFIAETARLAREFGARRFSFRVNTQNRPVAAARASYGVALLPRYLVPPHEREMAENEMTVKT